MVDRACVASTDVAFLFGIVKYSLKLQHGKTASVYRLFSFIMKINTRDVYLALRAICGPHNRPTERTIRYTIGKLEHNLHY